MIIVLGATGQIGSGVLQELSKYEELLVGVTRRTVECSDRKGYSMRRADLFDCSALKSVLKDGRTVLLMTPENPSSTDPISDAEKIIENYREAIKGSDIERIVGLSSIGAQFNTGTGNLVISNMLENAFADLSIEQIFVRPAYFFSNWLGFVNTARKTGVLYTFFPVDLKIHMVAPRDVARFIGRLIIQGDFNKRIYELTSSHSYSALDVAEILSIQWSRDIRTEQILPEYWLDTLLRAGFTEKAANGLADMTKAVIEGKVYPESQEHEREILSTTLVEYFSKKS